MEAAVFGVVGVLLGGVLSIAGNYLLHRTQSAEAARAALAAGEARAREERKAAYLRLLTTARRLRYVARDPERGEPDAIDDLRTLLSTTQYEIELISSYDIAVIANTVRRSTLDYLNAAVRGQPTDEARRVARDAVSQMITFAQRDLAVAVAVTRRPNV
jgi:hypothetical protein